MALRFTPLAIRNQEFSKKLQGYKPDEVRIFLSQIAEFVDEIMQENRSLRNEIDVLHKRIATLERQATTIKEAMDEQAQKIISEAQEQADQIVSEAEEQSREILKDMQIRVEQKREELYELSGIYEAHKRELLHTVEGLLQSIREFEASRENRNAQKAVEKLGSKMGPLRQLDPYKVIAQTVHRRRRSFFFKINDEISSEEEE
ncbi:DivIVA domain-containing protein [bacterium]|nr:DivIVA domain-containing protein [bacterium]